MTFVEVCGIQFSGSHEPAGGLIYQRLVDWDGRPGLRGRGDTVPGGHGVYRRSEEVRESIVVSVEAAIVTDSADEYFAVKRRVENMPTFGVMRVDQGDGVWERQVEVEQITIPDAHTRTVTKFSIDLLAPDPVRYREPVVSGPALVPVKSGGLVLPAAFPWNFGSFDHPKAVVSNDGTVPVFPRIILQSSVPGGAVGADGVVVFAGPRRMEFGPFSGVLVFDSLERRAWLNGVDVTRELVRREWPVVDPGETQEVFFEAVNPSPNFSLMVEYRIGVW